MERLNSINLLLVNTGKGKGVIKQLPNVVLKKRSLDEAVKGNDTLRCATKKPEYYQELFLHCGKYQLR